MVNKRDNTDSINGIHYQIWVGIYYFLERINNKFKYKELINEGIEDCDLVKINNKKDLIQVKYHYNKQKEHIGSKSGIYKVIESICKNKNLEKINNLLYYTYNPYFDKYFSQLLNDKNTKFKKEKIDIVILLFLLTFLKNNKIIKNKIIKNTNLKHIINYNKNEINNFLNKINNILIKFKNIKVTYNEYKTYLQKNKNNLMIKFQIINGCNFDILYTKILKRINNINNINNIKYKIINKNINIIIFNTIIHKIQINFFKKNKSLYINDFKKIIINEFKNNTIDKILDNLLNGTYLIKYVVFSPNIIIDNILEIINKLENKYEYYQKLLSIYIYCYNKEITKIKKNYYKDYPERIKKNKLYDKEFKQGIINYDKNNIKYLFSVIVYILNFNKLSLRKTIHFLKLNNKMNYYLYKNYKNPETLKKIKPKTILNLYNSIINEFENKIEDSDEDDSDKDDSDKDELEDDELEDDELEEDDSDKDELEEDELEEDDSYKDELEEDELDKDELEDDDSDKDELEEDDSDKDDDNIII